MAACLDVSWLTTYNVQTRISKPQPGHACEARYGNTTQVKFGIEKRNDAVADIIFSTYNINQ